MKFAKTTEVKLAGKTFTIYHWSPTKVITNMPKIGKLIAVPLGTLTGECLKGGDSLQDALPTAILYILERIEEGGFEVINILLEGVEVDGIAGKIDIDETFEDDVPALLELLKKVVEINYGCFFKKGGFGNLVGLFQSLGMVNKVQELDQDQPEA